VSSEVSSLQGITCRKHTLKVPPGVNSVGEKSWQKLLIKEGELYCVTDPSYPKDVTAALARTVGSIPVEGVPLSFTCVSNRGSTEKELKLIGQDKTKLQATDLQIPKDYKQVATPREVLASDANNEGFADFIK
jgi:hypothetical protein